MADKAAASVSATDAVISKFLPSAPAPRDPADLTPRERERAAREAKIAELRGPRRALGVAISEEERRAVDGNGRFTPDELKSAKLALADMDRNIGRVEAEGEVEAAEEAQRRAQGALSGAEDALTQARERLASLKES